MKISQLEYFCAATRHHSITQAAAELYVTQPAISSAIRELEREFSISLFTRAKNRLTLTQEGEIFYQRAQELLGQYKQTTEMFYDLGQQNSPVRIGIPPLLSMIFFPHMILEFQKKYPDIQVELFEYGSIRAASLVQEGTLDLALVNMHFYEIDKVYSHTLMTDQIVFCVSKNHLLAGEKSVTLDQLKEEPIILYNTDSVQNETLETLFKSAGIKPKVILHASQFYTIRNFIRENMGGAFLYASLLKNQRGIVGIPIEPAIDQKIGVIWKRGSYITSNTEKFINFAKKSYADE